MPFIPKKQFRIFGTKSYINVTLPETLKQQILTLTRKKNRTQQICSSEDWPEQAHFDFIM